MSGKAAAAVAKPTSSPLAAVTAALSAILTVLPSTGVNGHARVYQVLALVGETPFGVG